jgi:hypothetical protein
MKMLPLVLLLAVSACQRDHAANAVEIVASECVTCHMPDYQSATTPHAGCFPKTCGDCHTTAGPWQTVTIAKHEGSGAKFPIDTAPHNIACADCHKASLGCDVGGVNTDCIGCHTDTQAQTDQHAGVTGYRFDATKPNFCLSCHPDGKGGHHPEDLFPIASGHHSNIACGDCHNRALGPVDGKNNTDCYHCHTRDHHSDPSMPHNCLDCHPRGNGG